MAEEIINQEPQVQDNTPDYIEKIQELRNNSVSKEEYNKVLNDNKRLIDALSKGESITPASAEAPLVNRIDDLAKVLSNKANNLNNLDYAKASVQHRNLCIEKGLDDPYLPIGHMVTPTAQDREAAQRVADVLEECIEYADGDSQLFTNELMRRTNDVRPMGRRN